MTVTLRTLAQLAVFASLPGATWADITANDVWDNLVAYHRSTGNGQLSATLTPTDDGLQAANMVVTYEGTDEVSTTLTLGNLELVELDDGQVSLVYPDVQRIVLSTKRADHREDVSVEITRSGHEMIAFGVPGRVSYRTTAEQYDMALISHVDTGNPREEWAYHFMAKDLAADTLVISAEALTLEASARFGAIEFSFRGASPDDAELEIDLQMEGTTAEYKVLLPGGSLDRDVFGSGLRNGQEMLFRFGSERSDVEGILVEVGEPPYPFRIVSERSRNIINITAAGFYQSQEIAAFAFEPLEFVDLLFLAQDFFYEASVPLLASEEPQDFRLRLGATSLTMPGTSWDAFDPGALLPRDPISVNADVSLRMRLGFDMLAIEGDAPAVVDDTEFLSFDVNALDIAALGARLAGTGSGIFNNDRFDNDTGMPAIDGTAQMTLTGAHTLIDRLLDLKLLEWQQALTARTMLGVIFTPDGGQDTLRSDVISESETGSIEVNGIKLR